MINPIAIVEPGHGLDADTIDIAEAAACLWEAALELQNRPEGAPLRQIREAEGTSALRLQIVSMADDCHRDWLAAGGHERDDSFDWDWCPAWLTRRIASTWPEAFPAEG